MLLARLAACWLVGVAVADALWAPTGPPPASAGPVVAALGAAALAAAWRWRAVPAAAAALLGGACLLAGAGRVWAGRPRFAPGDIAGWRDRGAVTVEGRVAAEPERRDGGVHYRLAVAAVDGQPAHGRLLVQAARFPVYAYGDRLRVRGEVVTPPTLQDFDYRAYLARTGVHALVRRAHVARLDGPPGGAAAVRGLIALRARGRRVLDHALPEPEAALATGVLLGDDNGLPRAVADAFQRTNTTHVIAISGANIALLVGVLQLALRRWRRRRLAAAATIGVVAAYTLLVGADPAVVRAAIMGALAVFAVSVDRRAEAVTALGLAGVGMTAWRPAVVGDLGFQLSFAATAGLIAFAGRLTAAVDALAARRGGGVVGPAVRDVLNAAVLVTLAAQLTTWPIVARHTGQLAAAGLAANALIVPVQPAVMGLGAATIAAGLVAPPLGRAVGAVAWLPLAWTVRVVEAFAGLPAASLAWRPPIALVAGYYAAVLAVALPDARRAVLARARDVAGRARDAVRQPGARRDQARWAALALAAAAAALAWRGALAQPDGLLHVVALDVGQGDAILVVAPNGRRMLVDGGPSPSAVLDGLGRRFAPWDRRLDVVVLTHPDADHVGGLPAVLGRYRVAHVVQPDVAHDTPDARAWAAAVTSEGAAVWSARRGLRLTLDGAAGVAAEVRWPPPGDLAAAIGAPEPATNDHSVVLTIGYGAARVLLTGDIEAGVERALVRSGLDLRADVLKVAHHGSATSSGAAFLAAVAPRLAVVSVGADNRFGHPDPGVLDRLGPTTVRRTDVDGAVDVVIDGRDVWVR